MSLALHPGKCGEEDPTFEETVSLQTAPNALTFRLPHLTHHRQQVRRLAMW